MGFWSTVKQVGVATIRLPLRGIDWVKTKLGYVSVPTHREFVYLDETSVISLIASTTGGITEQKSTVKRRQISGSIKGGLGDKSSSLGANVGATKEKETQATRRYVIQSNFKELYDMRADDMIIADEYDETEPVPRKIWNALTPNSSSRNPIHETEVNRGDLAEINVDLGSHKVYNFYTAVGSIAEIYDVFPDDSQFVDELETEEFSIEILNAFSELVEHLLAGLVPIVGEAKNYGVIVEDGTPKIVSKEYASENNIEYDQLNIVGFVNSEKFWQEETRFLFEDDEYSVYCRLDNDEVMDEWMPIKLASVISSIDSDLGDSVHDLPEAFEIPDNAERERQDQVKLRPRLERFIGDLQDRDSLNIEQSSVDDVVEAALEETGKTTTRVEAIEEALKQLEQELDDRGYDYEISRSERGDLIDEALADDFDDLNQGDEDDEWYLEVSFTAIYW